MVLDLLHLRQGMAYSYLSNHLASNRFEWLPVELTIEKGRQIGGAYCRKVVMSEVIEEIGTFVKENELSKN